MNNDPKTSEVVNFPVFQAGKAVTIAAPEQQTVPLVFASPHSGRVYPESFLAQSRLDPLTLRHSEDAFVDELFDQAPEMGAPLIAANFPRVFVDANRDNAELDPAMYVDALPGGVNDRSPRVTAGLGVIARVVSDGQEIYSEKLFYREARQRLDECYIPYHRALRGLVDDTIRRFGTCLLVDCHSMPTRRGYHSSFAEGAAVDLVLGDCWGSSCHSGITDAVERAALDQELSVRRNSPYAGGFTTRHYGRPSAGCHAIQLEIDRALYMDEKTLVRLPSFDHIRRKLTAVSQAMAEMGRDRLAAE